MQVQIFEDTPSSSTAFFVINEKDLEMLSFSTPLHFYPALLKALTSCEVRLKLRCPRNSPKCGQKTKVHEAYTSKKMSNLPQGH